MAKISFWLFGDKIKKDAAALVFVFGLQFLVWFFISQKIKPDFTITPLPPSRAEMDIASLGDSEFAYRVYAQALQNAGDTFGETIPLKDYDFAKLEKWFYALDDLNKDSEYVPSIAAFYYGQSQNTEDCRYVIRYLVKHADADPGNQWRWYMESVILASYRMHDYTLAKPIAEKLINSKDPNVPVWAKTTVPFILHNKGDICSAYELVSQIDVESMREIVGDKIMSAKGGKHNFVSGFILDKIKAMQKDPQAVWECKRKKDAARLAGSGY